MPTVEGWEPSLADRQATRAFIAHGRRDPIIEVEFAQRARDLLEAGGLEVTYRESDLGHQIDPRTWPTRRAWLGETLAELSASRTGCQVRPLGVARLTVSWRSKKRLAVARAWRRPAAGP